MKKYWARFVNMETKEIVLYEELTRTRLAARDFKGFVSDIFYLACVGGCDAKHLRCTVKDCSSNKIVYVIDSYTRVNGSVIDCDIMVMNGQFFQDNFIFYRTMNIGS